MRGRTLISSTTVQYLLRSISFIACIRTTFDRNLRNISISVARYTSSSHALPPQRMEITSFETDGSNSHKSVHCNFCTTVQKEELVVSKEDLAKIQASVATCRFCALILGGSEAVTRSLYPKFADNGVRADKSSGRLVLTERNYSRAPKMFSFYTLPGM